ncbi:MAG: serine protease [Pirellulaceae bacterium]|nr:MAG: serine protease [Pirellulaceae bacterium]
MSGRTSLPRALRGVWWVAGSCLALAGVAPVDARAQTPSVPAAVRQSEQERIEVMARAIRPTIAIFEPSGRGGGSGVVVTPDGYALTNFHVVQPCGPFMKCGMADGQIYDAVLVGLDPTGDVALIKLFGRDDFPAATLGDSDTVQVGDWCFAVGNPFLLATDLQPTVTYGIVSGVHRYQYPAGTILEYADCIQTDAAINPGNSGGPLFNAAGELIGINGRGSFEKRGRVNVGVGYAISINQIKNFWGNLRSGRIVDHATLGATVLTDERGRVVVSNVLATSDAYRRGLRFGDEIVAFGGRRITTANGFKNVLGTFPKGWRVPLSFLRAGQRYDAYVRLAGVHSEEELWRVVERPVAPRRPQPPQPPGPQPPDQPQPQQPKDEAEAPDGDVQFAEEVRRSYERRRGFANYYFNRLERDRVWQRFASDHTCPDWSGDWTIAAVAADSPVEIRWEGRYLTGRFPDGPARIDLESELGDQRHPLGSGGLLAALHLWRRLLVLGPDQFGQVIYWGDAPLVGRTGLYDVLVAYYDVVECHFYFDRDSGRLLAMEMFPDSMSDPCELYFDDYRSFRGRQLPGRIRVVHGDQRYADLELQEIRVSGLMDNSQ